MSKFIITATDDTPYIEVDNELGYIEFSGKSLPEDSFDFFAPVEASIKKYISDPKKKTTINLKLEYLNSASQKRIIGIISLFNSFSERGFEVELNWLYPNNDEDIIDEGKEFAKMISLPMNIIPDA